MSMDSLKYSETNTFDSIKKIENINVQNSDYCFPKDINDSRSNSSLSAIHVNIRSLHKNFSKLEQLLSLMTTKTQYYSSN